MEVFGMLFERCHTDIRKRSPNQHKKYLNFRSKIQFDHPVYTTFGLVLTSPRPKLAVMTMFSGLPVTGSRVNMTPAASASTIS